MLPILNPYGIKDCDNINVTDIKSLRDKIIQVATPGYSDRGKVILKSTRKAKIIQINTDSFFRKFGLMI